MNKFKKGDVIAYWRKDRVGKLITKATKGGPSHVGFITNNSDFSSLIISIESLVNGIKYVNVCSEYDKSEIIKVYRLDNELYNKYILSKTKEDMDKIFNKYIGKKYSYLSAITAFFDSLFPKINWTVPGDCCSALIVDLYKDLGIALEGTADDYTPKDITELNIFKEVVVLKDMPTIYQQLII